MSKKNNGGPAFPHEYLAQSAERAGMSLRDWFAGKELAKTSGPAVLGQPIMYQYLAEHCYRMADAMLEAREKS